MVSFLGILATAAAGSVAFRKLYEYYWKNPNISVLNMISKRKTLSLRSLFLIFQKQSYNYSYSQVSASVDQAYNNLLTQTILFRYLKKNNSCMLYTDQIFSPWNMKQISNLLANGIEPQIKKFLLINQNAFVNKKYYQMAIQIKQMNSMMEIQIACEKVNPNIEYIDITLEDITDKNRDFLVFRKQLQSLTNSFIILSQDKERPRYRYFPCSQCQYNFITIDRVIDELKQGSIIEIWQTKNDNPIYKVIKSIKIQDQLISLSDNIHKRNKSRFQSILSRGNDYYKMIQIDL